MWKQFLSLAIAVASVYIPKPALADVTYYPYCRNDECYEGKLNRVVESLDTELGTLHKIETVSRTWRDGTAPPNTWRSPKISYVHCSTTRPAVVWQSNDNPDVANINLLNLRASPPRATEPSHALYWLVCHNINEPDDNPSAPRTRLARDLGYLPNIQEGQRQFSTLDFGNITELGQIFGVGRDNTTQQPNPAAEVALPQVCRGPSCTQHIFMGKTIVDQNAVGTPREETLYQARIRFKHISGPQPSPGFEDPRTVYVFCSKRRPAFIFESDSFSSTGEWRVDYLNPGGGYATYNYNDYPIYWLTCHNFVGPDFFSERMRNQALELGYPLNLNSYMGSITNPRDFMSIGGY